MTNDQWSERAAVIILGAVVIGGLVVLAVKPSAEVVGGLASTALGAIAMFVRGGKNGGGAA